VKRLTAKRDKRRGDINHKGYEEREENPRGMEGGWRLASLPLLTSSVPSSVFVFFVVKVFSTPLDDPWLGDSLDSVSGGPE